MDQDKALVTQQDVEHHDTTQHKTKQNSTQAWQNRKSYAPIYAKQTS